VFPVAGGAEAVGNGVRVDGGAEGTSVELVDKNPDPFGLVTCSGADGR